MTDVYVVVKCYPENHDEGNFWVDTDSRYDIVFVTLNGEAAQAIADSQGSFDVDVFDRIKDEYVSKEIKAGVVIKTTLNELVSRKDIIRQLPASTERW